MIRNLTRLVFAVVCTAALAPLAAAQEPSGPFSHIDPDERITVNFKDEDLSNVMELFSATYGLNIVAGPDLVGEVTINLFEAPVKSAFEQILATNGYGYTVQDNFILVASLEEIAGLIGSPKPSQFHPRVLYLDHVKALDVAPMVAPLLLPGEAVVEGPASNTGIENITELGGNSQATREMIVLYAGEVTTEKVLTLLTEIDVPPPQVLVEATLLSVELENASELGVDFTAFAGIDFQALTGTSTDVTNSITTGTASGPQLQDWLMGANQQGFTRPNANGLHIGIMRNQLGMFIQAVESLGNVTILTNPSVLVLNRQPAQVLVGRKIGYQTVTATETSTVQNIQFLEVGTSLVFRPYVSEDGYVRMEIKPKKSDGVVSAQTGLPEETTTEVTSNIMVRSGNTIVIGGLMESTLQSEISQVPILGNLPVVGNLFRRVEESEKRNEIIVLLTPHIVTERDLARRADESQERLAATIAEVAAGHSGYMRTSIARRMYAEAAMAYSQGNIEKALAKAEYGLMASPADSDLAVLAKHLREELKNQQLEDMEFRDAMELMDTSATEEF